jgi:hypothetical protein
MAQGFIGNLPSEFLEISRFSCDNLAMDQTNAPQKSRMSTIFTFLAMAAIAGSLVFFHFSSKKEASTPDDAGFDISGEIPAAEPAASLPTTLAQPATDPQSSLGMIDSTGIKFGAGGPSRASNAEALKKAEKTLLEIARKNEGRIQALAVAYAKKYPVVREYAKEWMSHPDLKKLNDDYNKDHDPIKFIRGLAKSPSFGPMVKKYGTQAPLQQFVMEVYTKAPSDAGEAAQQIMAHEEKGVTRVVNNVTTALGLGPLLGSNLDEKLEKKGALDKASQTGSSLTP